LWKRAYLSEPTSPKRRSILLCVRAVVENLIPNQEAQIAELVKKLSTLPTALLVVEAAGGLERRAVRALATAELPVMVVNPRRVRDFAKATRILQSC
jgi:transposase